MSSINQKTVPFLSSAPKFAEALLKSKPKFCDIKFNNNCCDVVLVVETKRGERKNRHSFRCTGATATALRLHMDGVPMFPPVKSTPRHAPVDLGWQGDTVRILQATG